MEVKIDFHSTFIIFKRDIILLQVVTGGMRSKSLRLAQLAFLLLQVSLVLCK